MKRLLFLIPLVTFAIPVFADNNSENPPTYDVIRVEDGGPTIDGVISNGEWDAASAAAGGWVELGSGALDKHNLRFRMLWDDVNLYILGETDFTGFGPTTDDLDDPDFNGGTYNPHIFIDPNLDGEDLGIERSDNVVDGYQITWSMDSGFTSRMPTVGSPDRSLRDPKDKTGLLLNDYIPGFAIEAHINSPFGNAGIWDRSDEGPNQNYRDDTHPGLVFAQNADNDDVNETGTGGGLWEWSIAWSELNATDPNRLLSESDGEAVMKRIPDPDDPSRDIDNPNYLGEIGDPDPRFADPESEFFLETGLYAVDAPEGGDIWAFEMGAITPDLENGVPSWSQPMGGDLTRVTLASWGSSGHGRIQFLGNPIDPLDCNEDGFVDKIDLTCAGDSLGATLTALNLLAGDFDADGEVAFGDFLILSANFNLNEGVTYPDGDANGDGAVNFGDFLIMSANFGQKPSGALASVPEPGGLTLLLIGVLVFIRRRP